MAKLIKQIHDLISLGIDKGYTQYITDSQIDDGVHMIQMVLWRDLIKQFPKNKRVRNNLLPFEVRASVTIASKVGSLPSDFEHEIEAWYTASSVDYPITLVESGFYRRRIRDVVDPPSATNLFASIYNDTTRKIEISTQVTPIVIVYFKKPTKPVYATTGPTNGQYIYDDASSTDVLWSDTWHDYLVERSLAMFGLSMRDGQVQRAGQAAEPKEATV